MPVVSPFPCVITKILLYFRKNIIITACVEAKKPKHMLQIQKHHTIFVTIITYGHVRKLLIWISGHIVTFVVSKRIAALETPVTAFFVAVSVSCLL